MMLTVRLTLRAAQCRMHTRRSRYLRHRFPSDIISHAVWLYYRFCLSFRDAEDLLAQRGVAVTYETLRQWCQRFGPVYARQLRRRRGRMGDTWHLDEVFVTIQGRQQYLWRAVDEDGDVLDILGCLRRSLLIGQLHPYNRGGHEESHPPVHLSHEPDRWDGVRYLRV